MDVGQQGHSYEVEPGDSGEDKSTQYQAACQRTSKPPPQLATCHAGAMQAMRHAIARTQFPSSHKAGPGAASAGSLLINEAVLLPSKAIHVVHPDILPNISSPKSGCKHPAALSRRPYSSAQTATLGNGHHAAQPPAVLGRNWANKGLWGLLAVTASAPHAASANASPGSLGRRRTSS